MVTGRAPNKHDVELRRLDVRLKVGRAAINGTVAILCIAALALPILAIHEIIQPLAGKTTVVRVNVALSIVVSISVVLNGLQYVKGKSQRAELKRLREEIKMLERRLGISSDE